MTYYDLNEAKMQSFQQQSYGCATASNSASKAESLASVLPRIINLSDTVNENASLLEASLGILEPTPCAPEGGLSPQPTPMSQLLLIENRLRAAAYSLENIHRHVNG